MGYRNLRQCVADLQHAGQLIQIDEEIDPHLEAAEIQRRVYQAGGPALLYNQLKGCQFPALSNLFGTMQRTRYLFRDALRAVEHMIALKIDPSVFWQNPWKFRDVLPSAWYTRPARKHSGPILDDETTLSQLPQIQSWPDDGGPFITLPAVYTESPNRPGFAQSNLGMYRVQLAGNEYQRDRQVGLHYQIHRSIGVHHAQAIERGEPLNVNIFVGGTPAMILGAVMPLPEGLSELLFAGALSRQRIPMICRSGQLPIYAEADFCISGTINPHETLPEGPFGDHLGYYSLVHDFPVMNVEHVWHRKDAIWPFTVVGRPPQEDTSFGEIIHELTGPAIPSVLPGLHAVHAVDAAGVHPLLLAIGSERYTPYDQKRKPQEILTTANAILGQGQLSLAKYLLIVAHEDNPKLDIENISDFFEHLLRRIDWQNDLHFQTRTTIDTLDYSGTGLNTGSKLVMAAAGNIKRELPGQLPAELSLPTGYAQPVHLPPGLLLVNGPAYSPDDKGRDFAVEVFCNAYDAQHPVNQYPLIAIVDDSEFAGRSLNNFLWVTFTRSNPAADVHGIASFHEAKHWGCRGSLVIDARIKPHHAPPLIEDPAVTKRVNQLAAPGGPLHGII